MPPPPPPCEFHGGDTDEDGCCDDFDSDPNDPEVGCENECDQHGGDADQDGCCDDYDIDPMNPNVGCSPEPGMCDDRGGDYDQDGCCADIDPDDEDPEVGCPEDEPDCPCEWDPMGKLQEWKDKLSAWMPDLAAAQTAAQGGNPREVEYSASQVTWSTFRIPFPWAPDGYLETVIDLDLRNVPYGIGTAIGWMMAFVRAIILSHLGIAFAFAVVNVLKLI